MKYKVRKNLIWWWWRRWHWLRCFSRRSHRTTWKWRRRWWSEIGPPAEPEACSGIGRRNNEQITSMAMVAIELGSVIVIPPRDLSLLCCHCCLDFSAFFFFSLSLFSFFFSSFLPPFPISAFFTYYYYYYYWNCFLFICFWIKGQKEIRCVVFIIVLLFNYFGGGWLWNKLMALNDEMWRVRNGSPIFPTSFLARFLKLNAIRSEDLYVIPIMPCHHAKSSCLSRHNTDLS